MKINSSREIRAIQIFLSNQKENLRSIESFMKFAKDWGFNTIFLYLEGSVRTHSFPYRKIEASYSTDEVQAIVKMANRISMDLIPGLATLGHAQHFLNCPELEHLRETDFWSENMLCPSNPDTYEFLGSYIKEIADLFPSKNFHIGCDEAWSLGACPACKKRIKHGEKREDIFIDHVSRVHKLLTTLGKKVWIWSDLFETFSSGSLSRLPRSIVLCTWKYDDDKINYDGFQGHFNNLCRHDLLAEQNELGFDTILCPWGKDITSGGLALTKIMREKPVLGGLLTNWETEETFLPALLGPAALIGRMWSHTHESEEEALNVVFQKVFPNANEMERINLHQMLLGIPKQNHSFHKTIQHGALNLEEKRSLNAYEGTVCVLTEYLKRLSAGTEFNIVEEYLTEIRLLISTWKIRSYFAEIIDPRVSGTILDDCLKRARKEGEVLERLAALRTEQWQRHRAGIENDTASAWIRTFCGEMEKFISKWTKTPVSEKGLFSVRLFLLEGYSAPFLKIALKGEVGWVVVFDGTFKPVNLKESSYVLNLPVFWKGSPPDAVLLTVSGYGGQGVQYMQLVLNKQKLIPRHVMRAEGKVSDADALLDDNAFVCFMGEKNTLETLENFRHDEKSTVEVKISSGYALDSTCPKMWYG